MVQNDLLLIIYLLCPLTLGLIVSEIGKLRFCRLVTFLCTSGVISLYMVVMWTTWEESITIRLVLYPVLLLAVIWALIEDTAKQKLFFFIAYYLITMAAELAANTFGTVFLSTGFGPEFVRNDSMARYMVSALSPVFMMSFSTIYILFYNKTEKALRRRITVLMLLLLFSQCMFTASIGQQSSALTAESVVVYAVICELMCIVVQYVAFETINRSVAAVKDRMELEHLKEKQAMDLKYIQMAQERAGEMSAFRHDFKNQLQVAYALLEEDPERAAVFLKELEEKVEQIEMEEPEKVEGKDEV